MTYWNLNYNKQDFIIIILFVQFYINEMYVLEDIVKYNITRTMPFTSTLLMMSNFLHTLKLLQLLLYEIWV